MTSKRPRQYAEDVMDALTRAIKAVPKEDRATVYEYVAQHMWKWHNRKHRARR